MAYYCNKCGKGKPISKDVYNYSKKHFGRALCRKCQNKERSQNDSVLKWVGEFTEKFGDVTKKIHDAGGMPLTLAFFGGLAIILGIVLPIIFSSLVPWWTLVIIYVVGCGLIALAVWLYLKEKGMVNNS